MKKTILITLLALLGMSQAVAQEYEYVPFVREGVKWVYYYINEDSYSSDPIFSKGIVYLNLELKGDTVINGKRYKAMHKYHGNAINSENDTIPIYLREENKVVYGIVPDGKIGYVVEPDPAPIADALHRFFSEHKQEEFEANVVEEKKKYAWSRFTKTMEELF